jgi:hypothetical protein
VKGNDVTRGDLIFFTVGGKSISKLRGTGLTKAEFDEDMVETAEPA